MQSLKDFFKSRNVLSHVTVAGILAGLAFIVNDEQARSLLVKVFVNHPSIVPTLVAVVTIYSKYSGAHSAAGIIAEVPQAIATIQQKQEQAKTAEVAPVIAPEVVTAILAAVKPPEAIPAIVAAAKADAALNPKP